MLKYTWENLNSDTVKICNWSKEVGFIPDVIVGISNLGIISATIAGNIFNTGVIYLHGKSIYDQIDSISISAQYGKTFLIILEQVDLSLERIKDRTTSVRHNIMFTSLFYNMEIPDTTVHFAANLITTNDKILMPFD